MLSCHNLRNGIFLARWNSSVIWSSQFRNYRTSLLLDMFVQFLEPHLCQRLWLHSGKFHSYGPQYCWSYQSTLIIKFCNGWNDLGLTCRFLLRSTFQICLWQNWVYTIWTICNAKLDWTSFWQKWKSESLTPLSHFYFLSNLPRSIWYSPRLSLLNGASSFPLNQITLIFLPNRTRSPNDAVKHGLSRTRRGGNGHSTKLRNCSGKYFRDHDGGWCFHWSNYFLHSELDLDLKVNLVGQRNYCLHNWKESQRWIHGQPDDTRRRVPKDLINLFTNLIQLKYF